MTTESSVSIPCNPCNALQTAECCNLSQGLNTAVTQKMLSSDSCNPCNYVQPVRNLLVFLASPSWSSSPNHP